MTTIVTRAGKGSALTWTEADANFNNLNADKYQSGDSPSFATAAITTGNITTANVTSLVLASNNVSGVNGINFRNRIINGDMRIDQRNAGAAVTVNSGTGQYPVDRFVFAATSASGVYTAQRTTTTPPTGHTHYTRVTVTTADASIAAGDLYYFQQAIEGYHIADFDFGKSTALNITLSFWIRSSVTGTFSGSITNALLRSYPFTFPISAANTWEQKSVTIQASTTGTWATDNSAGMLLCFNLGCGSTYLATAGSWIDGSVIKGATGSTSLISTLSATLDITGVQLEVGSVATPFERRPYGLELAMCQRYCVALSDIMTISGNQQGYKYQNQFIETTLRLPETMRGNPTLEGTAITSWATTVPGASQASSYGLATGAYLTITGALTISVASSSPGNALFRYTAATSFSGTNGESVTMFLGSGQNYRLVSEL